MSQKVSPEVWNDVWSKRSIIDCDYVIAYDPIYHLLKRLLEPFYGRECRILEVGCGSGIYTLSLLKDFYHSNHQGVLVDFSSAALTFARQNAAGNNVKTSFILADGLKLPFPDGTFDIVWNEGVNEHFQGLERQSIFNEMARVCKPGGQVIAIAPNALNWMYRLWKSCRQKQGRWEYGAEYPFSICELNDRMRRAGLKTVKTGGKDTLASFIYLIWLTFGQKRRTQENLAEVGRGIRALRRLVVATDRLLGPLGGLTGAEIGVKGIKQ